MHGQKGQHLEVISPPLYVRQVEKAYPESSTQAWTHPKLVLPVWKQVLPV